MLEILKAIVQGIVQGITEWLPVSSTGHMLLINNLWPLDCSQSFYDLFNVVIQLGSICAVLVLFFHKLNPFSPKKDDKQRRNTFRLWGKVLIASIPAAIIGLALHDLIRGALSAPVVIAVALILYGIVFILLEARRKKPVITDLDQLPYATAFCIGIFQMLSLIPGTSRSGSTIIGATLLGTSRPVAAEFSFFLAIPAMLGASGLEGFKMLVLDKTPVSGIEWTMLVIGTIVAFLVSLAVIRFFMNFIRKRSFTGFGYYRIALGVLVIVAVLCGWLKTDVYTGV